MELVEVDGERIGIRRIGKIGAAIAFGDELFPGTRLV